MALNLRQVQLVIILLDNSGILILAALSVAGTGCFKDDQRHFMQFIDLFIGT